MGIFTNIRRHASIAQGNFAKMFKDVRIAPLPEAMSRILKEVHAPEPDLRVLETLIAAEPELSIRILASVNSSLFSLRTEVTSIHHAITLLGIDRLRSLVMAGALVEAVPRPDTDLFDHRVYWTDTLLRALTARELASRVRPGREETVFTAMLVADVAVPVLLDAWTEYYAPILEDWRERSQLLAEIERERYGWDHGLAGAWILRSWDFPTELVDLTEAHAVSLSELVEEEDQDSVAPILATASLLCSCAEANEERCWALLSAAASLGMPNEAWPDLVTRVRTQYQAVRSHFGLTSHHAEAVFTALENVLQPEESPSCP